ncbi:hypothetical protein Pfo_028506 [Paulownia fortunei]|nr:hypothetical protein Pfo_028506 [Paulownia fortunei]
MKQISHAAIVSLYLLLIISNTSARLLLSSHQVQGQSLTKSPCSRRRIFQLMGLEECGDKDEACEKRRMVAEAHLDYIYTQHQHP